MLASPLPRRGLLLVILVSAVLASPAEAQQFTESNHLIQGIPDPDVPYAGFTVADLNGDGRTDIYHAGRMFRQTPDGTYVDVLGGSGITAEGQFQLQALPSDPNVDGLLDLLLLDTLPNSRFYDNLNTERYRLSNSERILNVQTVSTGGLWTDFDLDGHVDLFVSTSDGRNQIWTGSADHTFTNVSGLKRTQSSRGGCGMAAVDFDRDLDTDVFLPSCSANGGGPVNALLEYDHISDRFQDFSQRLGVNGTRNSHSAAWLDYNNDGWMDLWVANARADMENADNYLYRSISGNQFVDVAAEAGVLGPSGGQRRQSVAVDFDNDGWTDVLVISEGLGRLYMNQQDGTFIDRFLEVMPNELPAGPFAAADVNDDGWIDLLYGDPAGHRLFLGSGSNNWTKIALRNPAPNRLGLGAWVQIEAGGLTQSKQLLAGGGNVATSREPEVHFGLGTAETLDRVTITWPDGVIDVVEDLAANRSWVLARGGIPDEPPGVFDLLAPVNAAFVDTSTAEIAFDWRDAPNPESVQYTLTVSGPGVSLRFPDLSESQTTISTDLLAPNQIYSWSVYASDGLSVSPSTTVRGLAFGDPIRANATLEPPALYDFGIPELESGRLLFVDIDSDFDLDLLVGGQTLEGPFLRLYRSVNQGVVETNGGAEYTFKGLVDTGAGLDPLDEVAVATGDFNGDGLPDIAVSGIDPGSGEPTIALYVNDNGLFLPADVVAVLPRWGGPISLVDMDGDGDGDLLVSGSREKSPPYLPRAVLYRNDGFRFFRTASLPGAMFGAADWADIDGDGDMDFALTGDSGDGVPVGAVYRNEGGTFTEIAIPGLDLVFGSADWADYDGDGLLDLLVSGGSLSPELMHGHTRLFRQSPAWTFTEVDAALGDIVLGTAAWGDYEGDGDPDILISGAAAVLGDLIGRVYRNEDGRFIAELDFQGALNGHLAAGDYNRDGDLDFLLIGIGPDGTGSISFFINQQVAEPVPEKRE